MTNVGKVPKMILFNVGKVPKLIPFNVGKVPKLIPNVGKVPRIYLLK
jgi:hypothetical protein